MNDYSSLYVFRRCLDRKLFTDVDIGFRPLHAHLKREASRLMNGFVSK